MTLVPGTVVLVRTNKGALRLDALRFQRRAPPNRGSEIRWWCKAAKLTLNQFGKRDCGTIIQVASDNLNADRQPARIPPDWHDSRRQSCQGSNSRPCQLVVV